MKVNYHTHTARCNHARGTDEEFVLAAIQAGFSEIGFSDHTPWPYRTLGYRSKIRMELKELEDYCASILALKKKYQDQITIHLGLECEYFEEYMDWLKGLLESGKIDYALFGNHYSHSDEYKDVNYFGNCKHTKEGLKSYVDQLIQGMECGLFHYVAHPDLFCRSDASFDENCEEISTMICKKAKELDIVLEFNLSGLDYARRTGQLGYPHPEFWKIAAKMQNKVMLGLDAHRPEAYLNQALWDEGKAMALDLGLNLVTDFEREVAF